MDIINRKDGKRGERGEERRRAMRLAPGDETTQGPRPKRAAVISLQGPNAMRSSSHSGDGSSTPEWKYGGDVEMAAHTTPTADATRYPGRCYFQRFFHIYRWDDSCAPSASNHRDAKLLNGDDTQHSWVGRDSYTTGMSLLRPRPPTTKANGCRQDTVTGNGKILVVFLGGLSTTLEIHHRETQSDNPQQTVGGDVGAMLPHPSTYLEILHWEWMARPGFSREPGPQACWGCRLGYR
jgi:hypothetical protein